MSFDGYMGGALPNPLARVQAREAAAAADGNICQSCGKTSLTWFCPECDDDVIEVDHLIDIPSLIESRDDALTALAERDAEIERLRGALAELIDMGEWVWSEADGCSLYSIHLRESHHDELTALLATD